MRRHVLDLPTADIGALRRCNGMGEPAEDGDYVLISVESKNERAQLFRISLGAAALLLDELRGCLAAAGHRGIRPRQDPGINASADVGSGYGFLQSRG